MTETIVQQQEIFDVSAVMPCLNEEETLGRCVAKALSCFARLGLKGEVVVADNGSGDRSVQIAQAAGAIVVHVATRGYGAALRAGMQAARGRIIIMGDSDDSYDWSSLDGFIAAIDNGNDLAMGNRFRGGIEPGAMPALHRYLGNPLLSFVSRVAFRTSIGDFHCGMRALTASAFRRMELGSDGMEFATEMVASAVRKGLRIAEVPVRLYRDGRDRPPHLRSFRDGWRHLRFILSHSPDHIYLWPGTTMLTAGIALMVALVSGPRTIGAHYFGIHFMVLGAMLSLLGSNVISMGILARMVLGTIPTNASSVLRQLLNHPDILERVLAVGAIVVAGGLTTDAIILLRWLGSTGPMDDTVHLAVFASTTIVIGFELMFFAFLIFLIRARVKMTNSFVASPP